MRRERLWTALGVVPLLVLMHCSLTEPFGSLSGGVRPSDASPPNDSWTEAPGMDGSADSGGPPCTPGSVQTDPLNCGTCGHSCQGGACTMGVCQPVTLIANLDAPEELTLDTSRVYWTTFGHASGGYTGGVMSCALGTGCNGVPTVIIGSQWGAWGLTVDAQNIYWTNYFGNTSIQQCPLTGCGPQPVTVATSQNTPLGIVVGASLVYWTTQLGNTVDSCAIGFSCGASPTTIASSQSGAWGIAIDAASVFWANNFVGSNGGTIARCPLSGCGAGPTTLASGQMSPQGLQIDAGNVYWANNTTLGAIMKIGKDGQGMVQLAAVTSPWTIALDDTYVYFTSGPTGTVGRCAKAGCNGMPEILASGQDNPRGLAVNATTIYWANSRDPGAIMMLAK